MWAHPFLVLSHLLHFFTIMNLETDLTKDTLNNQSFLDKVHSHHNPRIFCNLLPHTTSFACKSSSISPKLDSRYCLYPITAPARILCWKKKLYILRIQLNERCIRRPFLIFPFICSYKEALFLFFPFFGSFFLSNLNLNMNNWQQGSDLHGDEGVLLHTWDFKIYTYNHIF